MANTHTIKNKQKREDLYDTLFKRAVAGDKESMASLQTLISSEEGMQKYSIMEDLRQESQEKMLDNSTTGKIKRNIKNFFGLFSNK